MGTYNYAPGGGVQPSNLDTGKFVVLKRVMKAQDIIAYNATLTAAAKITAGDVIEAIDVPAGFLVLMTAVKVSTAGTAGNTIDVGIGGATDAYQNGVDIVTLTAALQLVSDTYGWTTLQGKYFGTTDTIDVLYVADEIVGEFTLYAIGIMLD